MTHLGWIALMCISTWIVILTGNKAALAAFIICGFVVWFT